MLHIIVMGRLPVWAGGALIGGWLAATLYMRLVWQFQVKQALRCHGGGSDQLSASPPKGS